MDPMAPTGLKLATFPPDWKFPSVGSPTNKAPGSVTKDTTDAPGVRRPNETKRFTIEKDVHIYVYIYTIKYIYIKIYNYM